VTAGASAAERVRPDTRWVLLAFGFLSVYNGVNFLAFKVGVDMLASLFLGERLKWSKAAAAVALGGVALMVSGKASSRPEAA
jgi:drug/metabolite transporter (DMT)-like permease